jgi:hypothetical protein
MVETMPKRKQIDELVYNALSQEPQTPNEVARKAKLPSNKTVQSRLLEMVNTGTLKYRADVNWKRVGHYRLFWRMPQVEATPKKTEQLDALEPRTSGDGRHFEITVYFLELILKDKFKGAPKRELYEKLEFLDKGENIEIKFKYLGKHFEALSKFVRDELKGRLKENNVFEIKK